MEAVERHTQLLSPAEGATVTVGQPVTLTVESGAEAVHFAVASSLSLLATPDIASGPGARQAGGSYAFTSTDATGTPRTIYWEASFTRTLNDCEGSPVTFTTPPRALVVAAPVLTPDLTPPPSPLRLQLAAAPLVRLRRHGNYVAYTVTCSRVCTGTTRAAAWVIRRHRPPVPVPALDIASTRVSIAEEGSEQITYRYHGRGLRRLRRLLRGGARVELRLSAEASSPEAGAATATATAILDE